MGRKEVAPKGQASEPNSAETFAGAFSFRENSITCHLLSDKRQNVNTLEDSGVLGITSRLQSPLGVGASSPVSPSERALAARVERYALQAAARALLPGEWVAQCHRAVVVGRNSVDVMRAAQTSRVYFANLFTCGSVWSCPVCRARITEQRRMELREAFHCGSAYHTTLVTVTLQHRHDDALRGLLGMLRTGWSQTKAGKGWQVIKQRHDLVGYVTALEVTHGENGWHPHLHVLMVGKRELPTSERELLRDVLVDRFGGYVHALGGYVSEYHGVEVSEPGAASEYVAKWGIEEELTRGASKCGAGRGPVQLLRDFLQGDERAGGLYQEYAAALKGRRQLSWSRGLRALLGLGEEVTDGDAAAETVAEGDVLLAAIPLAGWQVILAAGERGALLCAASLGAESLRLWLAERGIVPAAL